MTTADAVDREVAWLNASGDGLPALNTSAGGPFGNIQGYWPRTPGRRGTNLFVMRRAITEHRFANIRRMATYQFELKLVWPLSSGQGRAEDDQRAFDLAVDKVLLRIGGYPGDKSHGGRFRSVAEDPAQVTVRFHDPAQSVPPEAEFWAEITYHADDIEFTG
ncbi:hypothetical protein QMK19_03695 [Streptomyces sp. H10-C2]|uniref:hypothetical protein n=1 Tax=unclassified Streptomyces TaxID=2593676 RepID=UPI0024B960D8|nr:MULTISPECIES: hypothetical protein [unclassified Streptomyces]MDJ0342291.1 hypothetical protein [Streptomyces sp. PH10-H1]MDJ0368805.1 hypothetical protein [Streptomyces sp. H10-C2]